MKEINERAFLIISKTSIKLSLLQERTCQNKCLSHFEASVVVWFGPQISEEFQKHVINVGLRTLPSTISIHAYKFLLISRVCMLESVVYFIFQ